MAECSLADTLAAFDLPAAAVTFLVLVWVFLHYQYRMADLRSKERQHQRNGHTPPPAD